MTETRTRLPEWGMTGEAIERHLSSIELSGPHAHFARAFRGPADVQEVGEKAFERFLSDNGFFSLYLPYMQNIEQSVVDMGLSLLHPEEDSAGNFTSGGTESNFSAMHAAKKWAKAHKPNVRTPNVVAPHTIHPSFQKAARYLDMEVITTPLGKDGRGVRSNIERAITDDTVLLAASAPSWHFAKIDPIADIAALAQERGLPMHVDACIGGYLSPFLEKLGERIPLWDFRVPGVTSISADLHKFGYCPKPASTIFWRHAEYQKFHFVSVDDPYLGPYKMTGFAGSRSAGPIFAAWAVMSYLGEEGYLRLTRRLLELKERLRHGLQRIEGLEVWDIDVMPMHFHSRVAPTSAIYHGLSEKGWIMLGLIHPEALTLAIDPAMTDEIVDLFLTDLREVTEGLLAAGAGGTGTIRYG